MPNRKKLVCVFQDEEDRYRVYASAFIRQHSRALATECARAATKFDRHFPRTNSTATTTPAERRRYDHHAGYLLYNVFGLLAPSPRFLTVYAELLDVIRDFVPE